MYWIDYQNKEFYTNILINIHKITIDYSGNDNLLESLLNIIVKNRFNNDLKFNNFHISQDILSIEKTLLDNIKDEDNYKSYLKNLFSNIYKDTIININFNELEELNKDLNRIDKVSLDCYYINDELIQRNFETFINNFNKIYEIRYLNMKLLSIIPKELFQTSKLKKLDIKLEDGFDEYFSDIILPNLTEFYINKNNTSDSYVTKFFSIILKSCPIMERFKCFNIEI